MLAFGAGALQHGVLAQPTDSGEKQKAAELTDLTPLRGLPRLNMLSIRGTRIADLTPIKDLPLRSLWLEYQADHEEFLRSLKGLDFINGKPPTEFWNNLTSK